MNGNTEMRIMSPLLVPPAEAAILIGVRKTLFYQMVSDGRLGPTAIELGSKRLYRVQELSSWVNHGCPPREQWSEILSDEEKGTISKGKNKGETRKPRKSRSRAKNRADQRTHCLSGLTSVAGLTILKARGN